VPWFVWATLDFFTQLQLSSWYQTIAGSVKVRPKQPHDCISSVISILIDFWMWHPSFLLVLLAFKCLIVFYGHTIWLGLFSVNSTFAPLSFIAFGLDYFWVLFSIDKC